MTAWGTPIERERKRRIDVAVWAYAYEIRNESLVDDATFDREARRLIDPTIDTGRPKLDAFFRAEFTPDTGMWVHKHPDKAGLERVYRLKKMAPGFKSTPRAAVAEKSQKELF